MIAFDGEGGVFSRQRGSATRAEPAGAKSTTPTKAAAAWPTLAIACITTRCARWTSGGGSTRSRSARCWRYRGGGLSCLAWVMVGTRKTWRVLALIGVISASDEILQSFNPSRVGDITDWTADMAGALAAVLLLTWLARLLTRRRAAVQPHAAHARP